MSQKLENKFRTDITGKLKAARGHGIYIQKHHGNMFSAGLPDILVQDKDFGAVYLEIKAVEEGTFTWDVFTSLQVATLGQIHLAGGKAGGLIFNRIANTVHFVSWVLLDQLKKAKAVTSNRELVAGIIVPAGVVKDIVLMHSQNHRGVKMDSRTIDNDWLAWVFYDRQAWPRDGYKYDPILSTPGKDRRDT